MFKKIFAAAIGGIIGAIAGFVIGLLTGTFVGGNYMTDFVFNGVRGYEAVGQIGVIIGVPLGAILGILLALKQMKRNSGKS
ncbi:hypothetical protein SDC9_103195 [bioreactor metagenome]|uniref:Uncharacterized protein n=1 Tax=bioreactor metagenome TaxID=1076179 RepID=A0A645AZQ5_9ZZZZ